MPKLQLPEGWFTVSITGPQQPVVEWLLNHLPEGMTPPINATTRIGLPRDLAYLTEVVQILGVDYRRAYESDSRSVPARPVTADAIVSNIRLEARGKMSQLVSDVDYFISPAHGKTWHDVARQIAITINGVGSVEVSAEEYARSPRKWVLEHLGAMKYQPDVYGTASATRIYEQSFR